VAAVPRRGHDLTGEIFGCDALALEVVCHAVSGDSIPNSVDVRLGSSLDFPRHHARATRQLYHEVKHKNEKNRRIPNFVSFRDRLGIFLVRKGCYDGLVEASARHAADVFSPEHLGDSPRFSHSGCGDRPPWGHGVNGPETGAGCGDSPPRVPIIRLVIMQFTMPHQSTSFSPMSRCQTYPLSTQIISRVCRSNLLRRLSHLSSYPLDSPLTSAPLKCSQY